MTANPIGLVVVAIAALVAGLILAYKHSETFRNIVDAAFGAIKDIVLSVVGWFGKWVPAVFGAVVGLVKGHIDNMIGIIHGVWKVVGIVAGAFEAARSKVEEKIGAVIGFLGGLPGNIKNGLAGSSALSATCSQRHERRAGKGQEHRWRHQGLDRWHPRRNCSRSSVTSRTLARQLMGAVRGGMKNAARRDRGHRTNVWDAVKGLLNSAIDKINAALEFTINMPVGPDITINPPDIPHLAKGGVVAQADTGADRRGRTGGGRAIGSQERAPRWHRDRRQHLRRHHGRVVGPDPGRQIGD